MTETIIRFENMKNIDKTLYYQCREYIKLCLLIEELQCFKNEDGEYTYNELINQTLMKSNLLLMEFSYSLKRIRKELDIDDDETIMDRLKEQKELIDVLEKDKINLQIKLQKIRDYAEEDGEVKQGVIEKVVMMDD